MLARERAVRGWLSGGAEAHNVSNILLAKTGMRPACLRAWGPSLSSLEQAVSPWWTVSSELLKFPHLERCPHEVYAMGFRILDVADDWTQRFNTFKFGQGAAGEAAVRGACAVMSQACGSMVVGSSVAVVAAIASGDEQLNPRSPVGRLASAIAESRNWRWLPGALSKRRHESRHNMHANALVRDAVVEGAYRCTYMTESTIVVVDDFATRGATISDIGRAVRAVCPHAQMVGVVLGKNERVSWGGAEVNNAHIPEAYERLWREG